MGRPACAFTPRTLFLCVSYKTRTDLPVTAAAVSPVGASGTATTGHLSGLGEGSVVAWLICSLTFYQLIRCDGGQCLLVLEAKRIVSYRDGPAGTWYSGPGRT